MDRRIFLTHAGAVLGTALIGPRHLFAGQYPAGETVERVHVIFKTHLDVGFTDLAANVVNTYFEQFIPHILSLTERIASEGKEDRYQWTIGSWLVYRYLEEASPENRRRMERAIERGDFFWHGLPFTTHTEMMDQSLLKLATSYSSVLDQRFGRKTIAAKMTDVPGHTRGMVPIMAEAGIQLFHIGSNPASCIPSVPSLFIWKSPEGSELAVMYDHDYGEVSLLPGGKVAVAINFTQDNEGPHTPQQISAIYADLRKQFPKARVYASNLNAVAKEISLIRDGLPVVTQEIGDTWIHGPGGDPFLVSRFRELARLRREWIEKGALTANGDVDRTFGKSLLCVPEHTWGLAVRYLKHWDVYDMPKFRASRDLPEFKRMESSWMEKRGLIDQAIGALPPELKAEANARLKTLRPERPGTQKMKTTDPQKGTFDTKHFKIGFDPKTGAINLLEHKKTGRQWAGSSQNAGQFSYQTFSSPDFDRFMKQYTTEKLRNEDWVLRSWGKPGLENSSAQSGLYFTSLKQLWHERRKDGDFFLAQLEVPQTGDSGCPKEIIVETFLPDREPTMNITLKWFNKAATRLPEACWFSFIPPVSPDGQFLMDKMGQKVSPMDVAEGGNRNMHGVISGVSYQDNQGSFQLETPDAFLVAPGRRSLLDFDKSQPDMNGGLHFCLYNNVWGTNFTMWYEDDMQFRFAMNFG